MSNNHQKENNPFYGKRHTLKSLNLIKSAAKKTKKQRKNKNRINLPILSTQSLEVKITDIETNITTFLFFNSKKPLKL